MDARKQYSRLLADLLGVLDATDQACAHWQTVEAEMREAELQAAEASDSSTPSEPEKTVDDSDSEALTTQKLNPLQKIGKSVVDRLTGLLGLPSVPSSPLESGNPDTTAQPSPQSSASEELTEIIASGREGAELIQRSLLDALKQQQITPIKAVGQPFDAKLMFAIDRQPDTTVPANTVLEEIVRGYQQGSQVLREAQVIVSSDR